MTLAHELKQAFGKIIRAHLVHIAQEKLCDYLYKILATHFEHRNTTFNLFSFYFKL